MVFNVIAPEKTVEVYGFKTFVIISPSMEPTINVNDAVMVRKIDQDKLNVGDIITFEVYLSDLGASSFVALYLGAKEEVDGELIFKTHAEGTLEFDEWKDKFDNPVKITKDFIIGKVAFKIPKAGYLINFLSDPIILLLLGLNIGIIVYIVYYIKTSKKNKNE
ncbi:MAG: S26 family signal peptidase [Candidatus Izemoplasmatales bacterium]|nr:S26 family signal peptidase [Candidatus Izemoplasmatales bacterium]